MRYEEISLHSPDLVIMVPGHVARTSLLFSPLLKLGGPMNPDPFRLALAQEVFAADCCRIFGIDPSIRDPQRQALISTAIYCRALGLDHTHPEAQQHVISAMICKALGLSFDPAAPEMPWDYMTTLAVGVDPTASDVRSQTVEALQRLKLFDSIIPGAPRAVEQGRRIVRLKSFGIDPGDPDANKKFSVKVEALAFGIDPDDPDAERQTHLRIACQAFDILPGGPETWKLIVCKASKLAQMD